MNTLSLPADRLPATLRTDATAPGRGLGLLLIAEALLSFAPLVVLGAAIGWPASLDNPAAQQLAAIATHADAVALGYGLYLLYSVLVAPVMIGLAARACGGLQHPLALTVAAFGALSALARAIGILRWLTVMPALAARACRGRPGHARADRAGSSSALTDYGGGIGEILGVSLFMALSLGLLCLGALRSGGSAALAGRGRRDRGADAGGAGLAGAAHRAAHAGGRSGVDAVVVDAVCRRVAAAPALNFRPARRSSSHTQAGGALAHTAARRRQRNVLRARSGKGSRGT